MNLHKIRVVITTNVLVCWGQGREAMQNVMLKKVRTIHSSPEDRTQLLLRCKMWFLF